MRPKGYLFRPNIDLFCCRCRRGFLGYFQGEDAILEVRIDLVICRIRRDPKRSLKCPILAFGKKEIAATLLAFKFLLTADRQIVRSLSCTETSIFSELTPGSSTFIS
jgi:hypothetical protein